MFQKILDNWPIIIIAVISAILLIIFLVVFIVSNSLDKKADKKVGLSNQAYNIYIIDRKNSVVSRFALSDLRNKVELNLQDFYSRAAENEVKKLIFWLDSVSNSDSSQFLELDFFDEGRKTLSRTLFKVTNFNETTGKIIIQSELISAPSRKFIKRRKKNSQDAYGLVSRSDVASELTTIKSLKGYTFAVRFSYTGVALNSNDSTEKYMYTRFKYILCYFASKTKSNRKVLEVNSNELILFDLQMSSSEEAVRLAISISDQIKKELRKEGSSLKVSYAIGIVQNGQYYHDFNRLLEKAEQVSIHAQEKKQEYFLYDKTSRIILQSENYSEQIETILSGGHLKVYYRPIVDAFNSRTFGYLTTAVGNDVLFTNYYEVMKYAKKYNKLREIYDYIERQIIPQYTSSDRTNGASLFLETSILAIDIAAEILDQIKLKTKLDIVLVFEEQEICDSASLSELLITNLKNIKSKGYGLALTVNDKALLLDPKVNEQFDFFIAKAANMQKKEKRNSITHSLNNIIASLQRYNKPIIVTDIPDKNLVEIVIASGVNFVSADYISQPSEAVIPVAEKRMNELKNVAIAASRRI